MEYVLNSKLRDQTILSEILQNRITNFDNSSVKWKFNNKDIDCAELEKKLINTYNTKIQFPKTNNEFMHAHRRKKPYFHQIFFKNYEYQ